jgi:hypothetical protein
MVRSNLEVLELAGGVLADDHSFGPAPALVTVVEYAEFDRHSCAQAYPLVRELPARFAPYLRFVFRHGPQSHAHSRAGLAAEAVEAAAEQGMFWKMHDCLFERQMSCEALDLLESARSLNLDLEKFADALCKGSHRARVRRDQLNAIRSHVTATPAFFINGVRCAEGVDRQGLVDAILQARMTMAGALCTHDSGTIREALARLFGITRSLRDAYKRHYWRCLPLPFADARLLCGRHAREQSELLAQLTQGPPLVKNTWSTSPDPTIELLNPETLTPDDAEFDPWFGRLLRSHEYAVATAHSVANRLAQLNDGESQRRLVGQVLTINERQAEKVAARLRGEGRVISPDFDG